MPPRKKAATKQNVVEIDRRKKPEWEVAFQKLAEDCEKRDKAASERADARDRVYAERHDNMLRVVNEITPWVRANIDREQKRKQTWDRVYTLAVSEATAMIVKIMGWVVAGGVALYLGKNTFIGQAIASAVFGRNSGFFQ